MMAVVVIIMGALVGNGFKVLPLVLAAALS